MSLWRAGCEGTRTSGSEDGAEETDLPKRRHRASVRSSPAGATLAAQTGATTKELMARLGFASPPLALIYQHAAQDRDQTIADELNLLEPITS